MSKFNFNDSNRRQHLQKLNNDRIDAVQKKAIILAKKKAARNNRLIVFFVAAFIILAFLGNMLHNQNERLEQKQALLKQRESELEEVQELQNQLKLQIAKLDDEEYIAKLARKELFLSEEGEIIFSIPKDVKKKEKTKETEE